MKQKFILKAATAIATLVVTTAPALAAQSATSVPATPAVDAAQKGSTVPPASASQTDPAPADAATTQAATAGETAVKPPESEIIVTGSRVVTNGYRAPTPVTVLGSEELKNAAPNITEALRALPQLQASSSPNTVGTSPQNGPTTTDTSNLRDLGGQRTLVLLDGRRPPINGLSGTADTSKFPLQLVRRVDIVTGGASAAYGSDAVSGVVNFILDTKFTGALVEARSGASERGDSPNYGFQASAGTPFAGGRGHVIVNVNAIGGKGLDGTERDFATRYYAQITNPLASTPGQPAVLLRENVNLSAATFNGIIITPGVLRDVAFDANGNPIAYRHGTLNNGTTEVGGDGAAYPRQLTADYDNKSAFAHAEFEFSDAVKVFGEASYGVSVTRYPNLYPFNLAGTAYVVQRDNAYLPDSIRRQMVAAGLNSIQVGKIDLNYGRTQVRNEVGTLNLVAGVEAKLPGNFTASAYYEHGESRLDYTVGQNRIQANARLAVDAVVNPATGQIVCRSTLTSPTNGCVPLSPFGSQPLTAEQRAYVTGTSQARSLALQDVVAGTVRGNLFSTWAGPVAAAVGAEYRKQSVTVETDAISQRNGFLTANIQPARGSVDVKEAFGEVVVPLLRDSVISRSLDLNAAIRVTDYSTSGNVTTWKVGLSDELFEGLRLRATYSRDIRAPNIGDLFGPRTRTSTTVRDPVNNNNAFSNITGFTGGNSLLVPERANTFTVGASYQPTWLRGLGLSVDYYKIKIDGAIATLSFQTIVDQCFAGLTQLCGLITRNTANEVVQIEASAQNISTASVGGIDFESSYRTNLAGGALVVRAIATYLDDFRFISPGAVTVQQAGVQSRPRWRGNLQATYVTGGTTISVQERYIGRAARVLPPLTIDDNRIPNVFYTNLTLRQRLGDADTGRYELFATVNNLFDRNPPPSEITTLGLGISQAFNPDLYDVVGRAFTIGGRFRF